MTDPELTPRPDAVRPEIRADTTAADTAISDVRNRLDRLDALSARADEIWGRGFDD